LGNIRLSHFSRKNKPLIGGIFSDLWAFCLWPPSLRSETGRNSSRLLERMKAVLRTEWWPPLVSTYKLVLSSNSFFTLLGLSTSALLFPPYLSHQPLLLPCLDTRTPWTKLFSFKQTFVFFSIKYLS
jgi:hypothetical protein